MDREAKRVGLKINLDKTNVIQINAKNQAPISIVGKNIKEVEEFTYLGAKVNKEGGGMEDLQNRLSKTRGTYVRLIKIWNSKSISRRTKMKLYKTLVLPVLMYGCGTWKMTKSDERVLNMFENKCLQKIHGIRWQGHVTTKELLARAEMSAVSQEVKRRRWKFIDHILRQDRASDTRTALSWRQRGGGGPMCHLARRG